jgi:hypothetical protein
VAASWLRDISVKAGMLPAETARDHLIQAGRIQPGEPDPSTTTYYDAQACRDILDRVGRIHPAKPAPSPTSRALASPTPVTPPGPGRSGGAPSLIDGSGVVHRDVPGVGYQPGTRFGIVERDTSVGGLPRTSTSPGLQPIHNAVGPVTGPGHQALYGRPPMTITGP